MPSPKYLQKFISDKIDTPGECHTYLKQQEKQYQTRCEENKQGEIWVMNEWKTKKASYVLQFLWHDICSVFDVIGPYYTCFSSLKHKFIVVCVLDALTKLRIYGFKTVCDGTSSNLRYSTYANQQINHTFSPKVYNPPTDQDISL